MLIISVPDRLVRDPATARPIDGTPTLIDPTNPYWARLLADGDVQEKPDAPVQAEPETAVQADPAPSVATKPKEA